MLQILNLFYKFTFPLQSAYTQCSIQNGVLDIVFIKTTSRKVSVNVLGNHFIKVLHLHLRLTVMMYGWYGSEGPRIDNGELMDTRPPEVAYIEFSSDLQESLPAALTNTREFNTFDFGVTLAEVSAPPTTDAPPSNDVTLGVICGVVLAALLIVLVIVLVCVFGRRRRDTPRSK